MSDMDQMIRVVSGYPNAVGGGSLGEAAREWMDAGFDDAAAHSWLAAGCFLAESARELLDLGVTPEQAERTYDGATIGYAVANGDLRAERVPSIVAEGR